MHLFVKEENVHTLTLAYTRTNLTLFRRVCTSLSLFTLPFLILFTTLLYYCAHYYVFAVSCGICCHSVCVCVCVRDHAHITSFNEHWTWHQHNNNTLYAANKIYYICRTAAMNGSSSSSSSLSSSCIHVCTRLHVHVHLLWLYNNLVSLPIESSM